ncbi:THAP domain-containing protein 1-like [Argiope bruennichi]|uniref:THAP domain-containing protein 1-like n=1 Tax=Argiope bruennichi TaxID=94029 RepID=UPI00249428DC|nr:THAP domain-containing protein 1-like [Argiope bruennichi]XP_055950295.1 THAP domain-containing protein 1-like [Argiope bruennichi]
MAYCAAINCKSKIGEDPAKTFHRFPLWNPPLLEKWLSNLKRTDFWKPASTSVLCSDHFEESCFDQIGNVKHIRGDAVPTLFFIDDKPQSENSNESLEKPQIVSVISLDNLFKSSLNKGADPLRLFHEKIEEICKQKKEAERKKIILQLLLSFKRFSVNQQKIKLVLNRSRILRRKMMQTAMIMILLTQKQFAINS